MGQEFKINNCGEIIRDSQSNIKKTNGWFVISLFLCVNKLLICQP